jgi:hypothetical protein
MAQTDEVFGGVGRGQDTKDYQDWLEEMRKETNALPMPDPLPTPDFGVPLAQKTGGNYSAPFALPQGGYVPSAAPIFNPGTPGTFSTPFPQPVGLTVPPLPTTPISGFHPTVKQTMPMTDADYYATQVMPGSKPNTFQPSTKLQNPQEPITSKNFGFAPAHDPVTGLPVNLSPEQLQKLLVKGVLASGVNPNDAGQAATDFLAWLAQKNTNAKTITSLDMLDNLGTFQQLLANAQADNFKFNPQPWGTTMEEMRNQFDPFTGQWIPKAGGGGTTPNITYRPRALGFTAGDGTPVYDRGGGFMPPGSNPLQPPTTDGQSKKWTPQAWQNGAGLIRWDERDWSTVSDMARPFIDAYLRGQGWTPTGQYGWYGPTEYKYSGLKTPNNIFFDPATLRTVPEAIANELRGLFAAKGWMPAITPMV